MSDAGVSVLRDKYGRNLTYLRLSVTDRCNLRCLYCAPQADFSLLPQNSLLTFEELLLVCRAFAISGVKKIRVTGGEPLVRRDIINFFEFLSALEGVEELCLTTNGVLLKRYATELYDLGVRHVNVSLDTLNAVRFAKITGRNLFNDVWTGIMYLVESGFRPLKINCVVMKGVNDDEIVPMAMLSSKYPVDIRFIEFMQIGSGTAWQPERFMSSADVKGVIERGAGELIPCDVQSGAGPAKMFRLEGAPGRIGFISPLSDHFCSTCNRLRLTPDGRLRLCLFSDMELDLREKVRAGTDINALSAYLAKAAGLKPESYAAAASAQPSCSRLMSRIGG